MKKLGTTLLSLTAGIALAATATACSPPSKSSDDHTTGAGAATSAKAFGGMSKLVKAAKKEGELNVIALPPTWANYGKIIKSFEKKYGIKINSAQPDGASQDEINAAKKLKGTSRAPDVFDLGQTVAMANTKMFAKYKVSTWSSIGKDFKDPGGLWTNDYGGYISIGYDSTKVPDVKSVDDLLKPAYKGKVALNGDPTQAGAAFSGVVMTAIANGGSADDIAPGVNFFVKLKKAGNFLPLDPTPATIESGQTPVVIDWDYTNASETSKVKGWKVMVPKKAVVGGYYFQAINKDAPHPAAARLWEEYLFSNAGQNLYLQGGARPVRADDMVKKGTIDKAAYGKLPAASGKPVILTQAQSDKAASYLSKNWSKVTS